MIHIGRWIYHLPGGARNRLNLCMTWRMIHIPHDHTLTCNTDANIYVSTYMESSVNLLWWMWIHPNPSIAKLTSSLGNPAQSIAFLQINKLMVSVLLVNIEITIHSNSQQDVHDV